MKKSKFLCGVMSVAMLASLMVSAFAADNEPGGNWKSGTEVTYTGTASEEYTVTVPAKLLPTLEAGDKGDVTVQGTWAANRQVVVKADETVTLTNSINPANTKTYDVTFAGITAPGSNTQAIVAEDYKQEVSVPQIENALFGVWAGTFNYDVSIGNVSDADAAAITFTIDGSSYNAVEDMTWQDWVDDSAKNTASASVSGSTVVIGGKTVQKDSTDVTLSDTIVADTAYTLATGE